MSDYTPTTEEVRDCYTSQKMFNDAPDAEFDRWLAEVKRQAVVDWQMERLAAYRKAVQEDYTAGENDGL